MISLLRSACRAHCAARPASRTSGQCCPARQLLLARRAVQRSRGRQRSSDGGARACVPACGDASSASRVAAAGGSRARNCQQWQQQCTTHPPPPASRLPRAHTYLGKPEVEFHETGKEEDIYPDFVKVGAGAP